MKAYLIAGGVVFIVVITSLVGVYYLGYTAGKDKSAKVCLEQAEALQAQHSLELAAARKAITDNVNKRNEEVAKLRNELDNSITAVRKLQETSDDACVNAYIPTDFK